MAQLVSPEVARDFARLPREDRQAVSRTLTLVAQALLRLPSQRILGLERQLDRAMPPGASPDDADEATLAELELRNALRVFAHSRQVERRCLAGPRLQRELGISRQRLQQLRAEKKLLGLRIPVRRELYYPLWQFAADGSPLPILPRLLAAAEEARLSAAELDALMVSESAGDGTPPAGLLQRGRDEEVLSIVRVALAHGA
jgi:hypothetical protein